MRDLARMTVDVHQRSTKETRHSGARVSWWPLSTRQSSGLQVAGARSDGARHVPRQLRSAGTRQLAESKGFDTAPTPRTGTAGALRLRKTGGDSRISGGLRSQRLTTASH